MSFLPPAWILSVVATLAGFAWIYFARSQAGRWHARVLRWLSVPFFCLTLVYGWFAIFDVPIEVRMFQSRWGMLTITATQAIILAMLAWYESRRNN